MIALQQLLDSEAVIEDLAWPFDFDLRRASDDYSWITLTPEAPFEVVAGEGAGGIFLACGEGVIDGRPILFATSEGQAGQVASNLTEFLSILLAAPYWRDLLKFSGKGDLSEMRKTKAFLEREYAEDFPELPKARKRLATALPIPGIDDPVRVLHDRVHATERFVVASDGLRFEPLFAGFTSNDNPAWG